MQSTLHQLVDLKLKRHRTLSSQIPIMSLPEEKSPVSPIFHAVSIQGYILCRSGYVMSLIYFKQVTVKLKSKKTAYIHTCKPPPSPSLTNQSDKIGIEDDCLHKHTHTHTQTTTISLPHHIHLQTNDILVLTPRARLTSAFFSSRNSHISMFPVFTPAVRGVSPRWSKRKQDRNCCSLTGNSKASTKACLKKS